MTVRYSETGKKRHGHTSCCVYMELATMCQGVGREVRISKSTCLDWQFPVLLIETILSVVSYSFKILSIPCTILFSSRVARRPAF
jgi:hypothetical protein